jgi:mono/diheme cytochrome c family protein
MSAEVRPVGAAMEDAEPKSKGAVVPIWLIMLLALVAYWGMLKLNDHAGGFNPQVYAPFTSIEAAEGAWPATGSIEEMLKKGRHIFEANCMVCHQSNGLGVPGEQKPPLAGSEWVLANSPNRIIRIVLGGLQGPVTVHGQEFGATQMPAWKDVLKRDEDVAAVLTFIRGNKEWGNNAKPVKPEEVKAIREKITDHGEMFTAPELQKLNDVE